MSRPAPNRSSRSRWAPALRRFASRGLLVLMLALLGGFHAAAIQGIAWVRMAEEARDGQRNFWGRMEVALKAEPCSLCLVARQVLQEDSSSHRDSQPNLVIKISKLEMRPSERLALTNLQGAPLPATPRGDRHIAGNPQTEQRPPLPPPRRGEPTFA